MTRKVNIEGIAKLNFEAAENSDEITVYLYDRIYSWAAEGMSSLFAYMNRVGTKVLHLRINSPGGNVFAAHSIVNLIQSSKVRVITYNDGLAASMGGVILISGDEVRMGHNALFMLHNASGSSEGDADTLRKTADVLDKMNGILADAYARRGKKTREEYLQLMASTTWYNASEALEDGLVDALYETKAQLPEGFDRTDVSAQASQSLYYHFAAQLEAPAPPITQPPITMDKKVLAITLGLDADASEQELTARLNELKAQAATVEDLRKEVETQRSASIKALVDGAIAEGKILEEQRAIFTANAGKDYELTAQILGGMAPHASITATLRSSGAGNGTTPKDKKFKDYSKEEIEALRKENWDAYAALFQADFGYMPARTKEIEVR